MEVDVLDRSREYILEGKIEKAQIILRRILNENPNHAKALELSGDIALKLGNNTEAIQRYESACTKYGDMNQYADAIMCLEKIVKIDCTKEEVFSRLADLYHLYGLPNHAILKMLESCSWALDNKKDSILIGGLRKVIDMQPNNLALRLSFIKILYSLNQGVIAYEELVRLKNMAEEAQDENLINEVNGLMPNADGGEELDPKSRIELGNLLYEIGSKDEAVVEFNKAVQDLIAGGEIDEAIKVLNRIAEIDPSNLEAINKINELQGGAPVPAAPKPEPKPVEDRAVLESAPPAGDRKPADDVESVIEHDPVVADASPPSTADLMPGSDIQGMEIFEDLGKDIEGFKAAADATMPDEAPTDQGTDIPQLEGQIADIEFLLDQAETAPAPSFELAKEFDDFRSKIQWREEDQGKLLHAARLALESQLYEAALTYVADLKQLKHTWPHSLEIYGSSLIRLGRYNEAMKAIAPSLLYEDLSEDKKTELRYLLAAAYEGMGDFDNAMREIERIISLNPNYKDVREIYSLLGGKEPVLEEARRTEVTVDKETPPVEPEPAFEEKHREPPQLLESPREFSPEPVPAVSANMDPQPERVPSFDGFQSEADDKPPLIEDFTVPVEKVGRETRRVENIPEDFGGIEDKSDENIAFL